MIEFHRGRFGVYLWWRQWTIGFTFGPEVWELHIGPLMFWFDPEGLHNPRGVGELSK